MADEHDVEELLGWLDGLLDRVEHMPGSEGEVARHAVAGLAQVYGEALARAVHAAGPEASRQMAADPLVGHLLALHGVHPDPVESRVARALEEMQGQLHGQGTVELESVDLGIAHLHVSGKGCGANDLASTVADILLGEAPDLTGVKTGPPPAFVPLASVQRRPPS